jgi:hypothetical protein
MKTSVRLVSMVLVLISVFAFAPATAYAACPGTFWCNAKCDMNGCIGIQNECKLCRPIAGGCASWDSCECCIWDPTF